MQLSSDGNWSDRTKSEKRRSWDCRQWISKGKCSRGESCSFKHDINKTGEGKGKRNDQVLLHQDHDHKAKTKNGKGAAQGKVPKGNSSSGKQNQPSCCSPLERKCTKPSCDCWLPPECVKHRTDEGCILVENVCFFIPIMKRQMRSKKYKNFEKKKRDRPLQWYAVIKHWVVNHTTSNCQDRLLDLRTWDGPCWGRAARDLGKHILHSNVQKTAERFIKRREQLGPPLGVIQGGLHNLTTRFGQKMEQEKQLGNVPRGCTKLAERTWRTKKHFSEQRYSGQ